MKFYLISISAFLASASASAQTGHTGMANHAIPVAEGGQAAFAALSEVITKLDSDPATDWTKVDIEALRQHLVDMDQVTMRTDVSARLVPGGAVFALAPFDDRARQSLERMVRLHSAMANAEGRYRYESTLRDGRIEVTVIAAKPEDTVRLRALGFHGLLTEGVHHQRHHWAMARGILMH